MSNQHTPTYLSELCIKSMLYRGRTARVSIAGSEEPGISVASIIQIGSPDQEDPVILSAARPRSAVFSACSVSVHQWSG